jgi:hypothetical protein
VSPRNCGTELTPIQSHTSNRHFKYPPGIRRRKRDHPPKRIERLWHLMITTENPVPTRPLLLSVRNSTPARPSPSTHPTHSITNLLSKRTVSAKIISHQARHNTTTTIIHQPPPKPPTSYSLRHDLHLLDRPLTQPGGNPSLFYFISGSSTAAQNNYLLRIGKGKGRKGAGQAGTGREGKEGRGHIWTDRLWGWSGKSGFLSFSLLSPDYFVGLFLFFNQFKNLFAFLLDMICTTIQRCFFWRGERASFFSALFLHLCLHLLLTTTTTTTSIILRPGSLSFTLVLLGLPSVCLSRPLLHRRST